MNTRNLFAGIAVLSLALVGCYGASDLDAIEDTGATVDEASNRSWQAFVGAWVGDSGPFRGLVFTEQPRSHGRHFFAYVDNGVRCVRAPCPSEARVEGYFTANTRTVTLRPSPAVTFPTVSFGSYQYTLRGERLTLSQNGRIVAQLRKVVSYCAELSDCAEQRLIMPFCVGRWTCTRDRACSYICGPLPAGEGERGGGMEGIPCAEGLRCELQSMSPNASGVCRRLLTCANVRCAAGTRCEETRSGPRCMPVPTCATILCAPGTRCEDSPSGARCVPAGPSCATIRCAAGYVCRETNGVGACIPASRPCGSIICPEGFVCCNPLRNICPPPDHFCIQ